jgi:hypothetical protein
MCLLYVSSIFKIISPKTFGPDFVCSGVSSQFVSVSNAADGVWVMLNACTPLWNIPVHVFQINYWQCTYFSNLDINHCIFSYRFFKADNYTDIA